MEKSFILQNNANWQIIANGILRIAVGAICGGKLMSNSLSKKWDETFYTKQGNFYGNVEK